MDSEGVIRQIIERSDEESSQQAEDEEEDDRLAQAIAMSLTSPDGTSQVVAKAKCARVVRFNLPLLDPPPREVPVIPRLRSYRFRPPPAPITPKPGPPPAPTREQRMSATMRFFQPTGQRSVPTYAAALLPDLQDGIME